jgi:hypothetical protein
MLMKEIVQILLRDKSKCDLKETLVNNEKSQSHDKSQLPSKGHVWESKHGFLTSKMKA